MTSAIAAGDIVEVKCFKDLKVYLLRGFDGNDLVIKTDAVGDEQITNAGRVVKAIDPVAKMKILTAAEKQELVNYCKYVEDLDAFFEDLRKGLPGYVSPIDKQLASVEMLRQSLSFGFPFTKMQKQTIHNIEEAAIARGEGSKDLMRQFVRALKADGGLEGLGEVIAADLFNGNTDRFYPGSASQKDLGPFTFNLRVTVNLGNVMLIVTGAGLRATALDYVDPQSAFKTFGNAMTDAQKAAWGGRTLAKSSLRSKFADDVIHDLEAIFNPKKSAFSMRTKLGLRAASRVEKGMVRGGRAIYAAMNARNPKPAGLADRLAILAGI